MVDDRYLLVPEATLLHQCHYLEQIYYLECSPLGVAVHHDQMKCSTGD